MWRGCMGLVFSDGAGHDLDNFHFILRHLEQGLLKVFENLLE